MNGEPQRGEVWIVLLDKRRPAVVVSNEAFSAAPKLLVVPLTGQLHREAPPATVRIPKLAAGLPKGSIAQAAEVQPVWRSDLVEPRGRLTPQLLEQLDDALRLALGL